MGNTQQPTKPFYDDGSFLPLHSVFYTIQGEGPFSGRPAVFIRLRGCNLRCHWCDTEYSRGELVPVSEIVAIVCELLEQNEKANPMIVLTGGEPLIWNVAPLLRRLSPLVSDIQIESNGTACLPNLLKPWHELGNVYLVISPKTGKLHPGINPEDVYAWKYVLDIDEGVDEDGFPAGSTQVQGKKLRIYRPKPGIIGSAQPGSFGRVFVSPMDNHNRERNLKFVAQVALNHGFSVSLQIHKILEVE